MVARCLSGGDLGHGQHCPIGASNGPGNLAHREAAAARSAFGARAAALGSARRGCSFGATGRGACGSCRGRFSLGAGGAIGACSSVAEVTGAGDDSQAVLRGPGVGDDGSAWTGVGIGGRALRRLPSA